MFGWLLFVVVAEIPQLPIDHRTIGKEVHPTQVSVWDYVIDYDDSWRAATLSAFACKIRAIDRRFEAGMHFILFELR